MSETLKRKAVQSVIWNLLEKFGIQFARFFMGILLARLLTPADYGLIGMVTVFFVVAQVFIDSGFGSAYVQKKEVDNTDADTVFYTNIVVSGLLYVVLWFAAPYIADFYEQPLLADLVKVMGVVVIINAFNIIQIAQLERAVNFKRRTKITLAATMISGIAGLVAAYFGLGVWSLVIQSLANRFLTTVGLWVTSKWYPGLNFSYTNFKQMFAYGSWLLLGSITNKLFDNIYVLVIGKFFPAAQLGFYSKAKNMRDMLTVQFSTAVSSVAFPIFAQWQSDKQKLRNGIKRFLQHTLLITVPLLAGFIVITEPFVMILLTEKWAPMIPYLRLLCVVGMLYPIHAVNVKVLMAQGKTNLNFRLEFLKSANRIINIVVMYRFGVLYIIMGEIVTSLIALVINSYYTKKLVGYGIISQLKDIVHIFIGAGIGLAGGLLAGEYIANYYLHFFVSGSIFVALYLGYQLLLNRDLLIKTLQLKSSLMKIKNKTV